MRKVLLTIVFFCSVFTSSLIAIEAGDYEQQTVDNSIVIDRIGNNDIEITIPSLIFTFSEVDVKLKFINSNHTKLLLNKGKIDFIVNGEDMHLLFVNGEASFKHQFDKSKALTIYTEDFSYKNIVTAYPLWAFMVPLGFIVIWIIRRMMKK
ncbi:MAG TPA: hypothetical protein VGC65_10570 [Bacteroidia bacterium]|jgi:hypothetical protein